MVLPVTAMLFQHTFPHFAAATNNLQIVSQFIVELLRLSCGEFDIN